MMFPSTSSLVDKWNWLSSGCLNFAMIIWFKTHLSREQEPWQYVDIWDSGLYNDIKPVPTVPSVLLR